MFNRDKLMAKDIRVASKFKVVTLILIGIIAVAIILTAVIGFNNDYDFRGGYELTVNMPASADSEKISGLEKDITAAIESLKDSDNDDKSYGFKVLYVYRETLNRDAATESTYSVFRLNFTGLSSAELVDAVADLTDVLKKDVDGAGVVGIKSCSAPAKFWKNFGTAVLCAAAVIILAGVYMVFRRGFIHALILAIVACVNALLYFAFAAITRLPFGGWFLAVMACVMVLAMMNTAIILNQIGENEKREQMRGKLPGELADISFKESIIKLGAFTLIALIAVAGMFVGTLQTVYFVAPFAIGVVTSVLTSVFWTPGLYAKLKDAEQNRLNRYKQKRK